MMRKLVMIVVTLISTTSCAVYSHEPSGNEAHAIVIFEEKEPVEGMLIVTETTPMSIDGKRKNGWSRWDFDKIRVNPGPVAIETLAQVSNGYVAYATLEFDAKQGETYSIGGDARKTQVRFYVKDSSNVEHDSSLGPMELSRGRSDPITIYMP